MNSALYGGREAIRISPALPLITLSRDSRNYLHCPQFSVVL